MPEYVYALHDFAPEHEDEISFRAGERIEVIEKDDLYQDGWWQGRNLTGKIGLFPQGYTNPAPPTADLSTISSSSTVATSSPEFTQSIKSPLQPLVEEPESGSPPSTIIAPVPNAPTAFLNDGGSHDGSTSHLRTLSLGDGEVMKATMTDVQKAIEQLGKGRSLTDDNDDGARSFSFASTREGGETETDIEYDMSDVDGVDSTQGESYHKDTRMKLAEKARRAIEEAKKLEDLMKGTPPRLTVPPVEVEVSDESEGEGDENQDFTDHATAFSRSYPKILEEDEEADTDTNGTSSKRLSGSFGVPSRESATPQNDLQPTHSQLEAPEPKTAVQATFAALQSPRSPHFEHEIPLPITSSSTSSASQLNGSNVSFPQGSQTDTSQTSAQLSRRDSLKVISHGAIAPSNGIRIPVEFNPSSSARSPSPLTVSPASQSQPVIIPSPQNKAEERKHKGKKHPSDWSVDDVVDWLKNRGFDQDVCDKFTEQDISGDVLLELDVNLLKSEIGIMAFGKRMRIANAITELRRPPSIVYSDHPEPSPLSPHIQILPTIVTHSRTQSQSQSHHSFPGTSPVNGHTYSQSVHSSLGSPLGQGAGQLLSTSDGPNQMVVGSNERTESLAPTGSIINTNGKLGKTRPSQLSLSPSDGALSTTAKVVVDVPEERRDDRGHVSESEVATSSGFRRRLFGDLASPKERDRESKAESTKSDPQQPSSKVTSSPPPSATDKESRRSKKSIDGGKGSERLSIFGGTFGPSLGRNRKPPPRVSEDASEKSSLFPLPRLHSTRRVSSVPQRLHDVELSSQEKEKAKEVISPKEPQKEAKEKEQTHSLLRRRASSAVNSSGVSKASPNTPGSAPSPLKPGLSVIEQIGEPDHNGWMRKKGDRYNSWKLRYFVLKGTFLYWLRSNDKSETKVKGYINILGYKVTVDESIDPGRYGFRIDHEQDKPHFFSYEEKGVVREWMKAIMKATIGRDYTKPVLSSCNIPTIPLVVAQAMNPAPRPPSPTARDATQKALRRDNLNQLSSRDARILMGLPGSSETYDGTSQREPMSATSYDDGSLASPKFKKSPISATAPPRPFRRNSQRIAIGGIDENLLGWANSHLPDEHQVIDSAGPLYTGLALLRLAESIKGRASSPPVPDSAFPTDPSDDKLDGLFKLFDFLLDNDVKMGSVSINDVRQGKRDKIVQLLKALKAWEDKRRAIVQSIGASGYQAAGFMTPMTATWA